MEKGQKVIIKALGFLGKVSAYILGNALFPFVATLGVIVIAFLTTILRHIKEGSFFESMFWFAGTFALCFLILCLILILLRKHFYKHEIKSLPSASPSSHTIADDQQINILKYGKTAIFLVVASILLLLSVAAIKWHQYIYDHRMKIIVSQVGLSDVTGQSTSCFAAFSIILTNGGPDSMPFNWTLLLKIPTQNNLMYGQPVDWNLFGLSPRVGPLDNTNNLLVALSKEPVKHGETKMGTIMFIIPGIPKLSMPFGTKFIVGVQDGQGHIITTISAWTGPIGERTVAN